MDIFMYICAAVIGYLIGSVNIAIMITGLFMKKDVRTMGSKNAGATNVARVFGMKLGLVTLLGDFVKTAIAMVIGFLLQGENGMLVAAMACLVGHCWPVYYGFRGGKGVAVGGAIALVYDWRFFLLLIGVFLVAFLISQRVSVCSLAAATAYPFGLLLCGHVGVMPVILGCFTAVTVWFMHRENLKRLLAGTEPKFRPKSSGER